MTRLDCLGIKYARDKERGKVKERERENGRCRKGRVYLLLVSMRVNFRRVSTRYPSIWSNLETCTLSLSLSVFSNFRDSRVLDYRDYEINPLVLH